jgi:hypothetical protein
MDSYRCELVGIYCIMVVVQKFCEYYHISKGSIELGCDGLSALESTFDKGDYLFHDIPSYDLISAILSLRRKSPLRWLHRHVRGHQDRDNRDLDVWANRNILMDTRAKQHLFTKGNLGRCGWVLKSSLPDFNRRFTPTFTIMMDLHTGRINRAAPQRL